MFGWGGARCIVSQAFIMNRTQRDMNEEMASTTAGDDPGGQDTGSPEGCGRARSVARSQRERSRSVAELHARFAAVPIGLLPASSSPTVSRTLRANVCRKKIVFRPALHIELR